LGLAKINSYCSQQQQQQQQQQQHQQQQQSSWQFEVKSMIYVHSAAYENV